MSVCQTHLLPVRLLQRKRENTNQRLEKKKTGSWGGRERRGRGKRYKHQRENVGVTVVTVTRAGNTTATSLNPTNLKLYFLPSILLFLLTLLKLRGEMKKCSYLQESGSLGVNSQHTNICSHVSHACICSRLACHASMLLLRYKQERSKGDFRREKKISFSCGKTHELTKTS